VLSLLTLLLCWQEPVDDAVWRTRMLADIQAIVETHRPSPWDVTDPSHNLQLGWNPDFMDGPVTFERRIRLSPDVGVTLVEIWRLPSKDLTEFLKAWGHPGQPTWENLLATIPKGRVVANPDSGELVIMRDFPLGHQTWNTPPYRLDALPTKKLPELAGDLTSEGPVESEESETASSFSLFVADLVNEELLDREGAGVRISQKWRFEGRASRFTPQLRIERRLKFNFDNTYSVFDIYTVGLEMLVGDRSFRMDDDYTSEAGLLFEAEKRFIVVRHGYRKWYEALFTSLFSPTRLPYNAKNLEKLPIGVRIIMPTTTGLTLVERYAYTGLPEEDYPLEVNGYAGTTGTFFISLSKRTSSQVDLRFGARIERPFFLEFRARPDFDGPLDPRRLLMGTVIQSRLNRTYGSRIFLQKNVNLSDAEQVEETVAALRRGVRLNGLVLGTAAIFNFTFSPRIDTYLLDRQLKGKLPELEWESRIESKYKEKEAYGKIGLRPASARAQKTEIVDDWQILNLMNGNKISGKSASFVYQRNFRFLKFISRRRLQVLSLEGGGGDEKEDHSIQILDIFSKSRLKERAYERRVEKIQSMLGDAKAIAGAGSHPPEKRWKNAEMGYRLLISESGLNKLADHLLSPSSERVSGRSDPLREFLRRHPILRYRLKRYRDEPKRRDVLLGKYLFKLAKKKGPLHEGLALLKSNEYFLEYREIVQGQVLDQGQEGNSGLTNTLAETYRIWEELEVFDDIFTDRHISNRLR